MYRKRHKFSSTESCTLLYLIGWKRAYIFFPPLQSIMYAMYGWKRECIGKINDTVAFSWEFSNVTSMTIQVWTLQIPPMLIQRRKSPEISSWGMRNSSSSIEWLSIYWIFSSSTRNLFFKMRRKINKQILKNRQ